MEIERKSVMEVLRFLENPSKRCWAAASFCNFKQSSKDRGSSVLSRGGVR